MTTVIVTWTALCPHGKESVWRDVEVNGISDPDPRCRCEEKAKTKAKTAKVKK